MKTFSFLIRYVFSFLFALFFLSLTGQAQTFSSPVVNIPIPDGPNSPLCTAPGAYVCKDILVSGLPGNAILLSAGFLVEDHANVGTLDIEIRGPGGAPTFMPFSRTGATTPTDCGDSTDIDGDYTFRDGAVGNWWATAAGLIDTEAMTSGTYAPSFPGGGPSPPAGNPNNTMTQTFMGITNGTWNICARDWGDNGGGRLQVARLTFSVATAGSVTIGGRVLNNGGSGIRNAVVTLTGGSLAQPLIARTSSFGYYSFTGVPAGDTYVISVQGKGLIFNNPSRVINAQDDIADADFVAEP